MTSVSRAPEPYLSPLHVAEVMAAGGAVLTNDHLGARIRWPGGRVEEFLRLPSGELEVTHRDTDGEVLRREAWGSGNFFAAAATRSHGGPEAAEEARAAWQYVALGGSRPIPGDARRLMELCGARILEAAPERRREALEEALLVVWLLKQGKLLDPGTAARYRTRLEAAALELEPIGAPA